MKNTFDTTVGEIVAEDFRTASIFSKYGIDFCCKGDKTLETVCEKKAINIEEIKGKLEEVTMERNENIDYKSWPLDLLADYIEKTHHRYIREKTPSLLQFLNKVQKVHGGRHPELLEIFTLFSQSAEDLENHLVKEERILFPFIRRMIEIKNNNLSLDSIPFGTVENPIAMMMEDHSIEGDRFRKISELTQGYTTPPEACNTYKVSFAMLDEFEQNLHKHIHLENNILFPQAIKLEQSLR